MCVIFRPRGSIERAAERTFLLMLPGISMPCMRAGLARVGGEDTRADGGLGWTLSPTGRAGVGDDARQPLAPAPVSFSGCGPESRGLAHSEG